MTDGSKGPGTALLLILIPATLFAILVAIDGSFAVLGSAIHHTLHSDALGALLIGSAFCAAAWVRRGLRDLAATTAPHPDAAQDHARPDTAQDECRLDGYSLGYADGLARRPMEDSNVVHFNNRSANG